MSHSSAQLNWPGAKDEDTDSGELAQPVTCKNPLPWCKRVVNRLAGMPYISVQYEHVQ